MSPVESLPPCPECGADPVSSLACLACGTLLEEHGDDHFARLGQSSAQPFDKDAAEAAYLRLSRLLHPDFHGRADPAVQALAIRHSASLNQAWSTLTDEQARAEYLLELHHPGTLERHKTLSPAFLMEAMELSEELETALDSGCGQTIQRIRKEARRAVEERMHGVTQACGQTIDRIARDAHHPAGQQRGQDVPAALITQHQWNTEQIATLLHQARVYRRILRDTEKPVP